MDGARTPPYDNSLGSSPAARPDPERAARQPLGTDVDRTCRRRAPRGSISMCVANCKLWTASGQAPMIDLCLSDSLQSSGADCKPSAASQPCAWPNTIEVKRVGYALGGKTLLEIKFQRRGILDRPTGDDELAA